MPVKNKKKVNVGCVFCGGRKFKAISKQVRDSSDHKVLKCQKCGLLQLSPMPSPKEDKEFYDQNRQAKNIKLSSGIKTIRRNALPDTKRRVELVSGLLKKGKSVLDIASGYGFFLEKMLKSGYKVMGIEISRERRKDSAKITKARVLNVNLLENDSNVGKFDVITMFHVLEHIKDPVLFLEAAKKRLDKNGRLIIEVPNADDMLLEGSKRYRDFYWQRAHLLYLNADSLKKIARKAGLSVVAVNYTQRYSLENFMNWFVMGKPQLSKPVFKTESPYAWLENYYKEYLRKTGNADTITLIAK